MSIQILEGELQKLGEKGLVKSYKKRNFRLRSDGFLRYYDGVKETGSIDMTIVQEVKTDDAEGADFQIVTEGRVYQLRAATYVRAPTSPATSVPRRVALVLP
jgi:hypothetical protein